MESENTDSENDVPSRPGTLIPENDDPSRTVTQQKKDVPSRNKRKSKTQIKQKVNVKD